MSERTDLYFVAENLVLPPGCRPCHTGRKLGQVRDNRLCHLSKLFVVSGVSFQVSGVSPASDCGAVGLINIKKHQN
ncbi:MAG: hypothetical protein PVF32_19545 [Desulfobacterales bacterium]|jgi:hypothetical protein